MLDAVLAGKGVAVTTTPVDGCLITRPATATFPRVSRIMSMGAT